MRAYLVGPGKEMPPTRQVDDHDIVEMFQWIKGDVSDTNKTLARSDERLAFTEGRLSMVEDRFALLSVQLAEINERCKSVERALEAVRGDTYWLRYHPSLLQRFWAFLRHPFRRC